jgi:hypothetical protein
VLEKDEVHLNLPGRNGILVGKVVVCRNPAYHPGGERVSFANSIPTEYVLHRYEDPECC